MNLSSNNHSEHALSAESVAKGHGKFPYIIVRKSTAVYIQMPIHFIAEKPVGLTGIFVNSTLDNDLENASYLLDIATEYKEHLESKNTSLQRMCLVLSPTQAYFFEEAEILFSTSIPTGGMLMNNKEEVIALGHSHFVSNREGHHPLIHHGFPAGEPIATSVLKLSGIDIHQHSLEETLKRLTDHYEKSRKQLSPTTALFRAQSLRLKYEYLIKQLKLHLNRE